MQNCNYKIFVINLDSSNTRWLESKKQLNIALKDNTQVERISAVDGRKLNKTELNKHFDTNLNRQQYHKTLTTGEIACYMSHRKVWNKIVSDNLDFALVLEDDFLLTGELSKLFDTVTTIEEPWHCIKLAEYPIKRRELKSQTLDNFRLVNYDKVPARTCAQIISHTGAKQLLLSTEKFGRPIDIDIQHWWEHHLKVLGLKPYTFMINHLSTSDIENIFQRKNIKTRHISKIFQQFYFYIRNQQAIKEEDILSC